MRSFKINIKNNLLWLFLLGVSLTQGCVSAQKKPESTPVLTQAKKSDCVQLAQWQTPGKGSLSNAEVIAQAAKKSVILLGETHINEAHHRWQLQMLAGLYAIRPDMVIGFEMFPRRVQPILDKWIAGKYTEKEFLSAVGWGRVWSTDAKLYLPLFYFARMNRIPILALNIDPNLRQQVSKKGFDGVPVEEREGVTRPAEASDAYLDYLLPIYQQHNRTNQKDGKINHDDPDFRRFIASQQLWDRAMAQILDEALDKAPDGKKPLVVGIMGMGHVQYGYGVPHQLKDLGTNKIASLIPWDINRSCKRFVPGIADAVFGVQPHLADLSLQPKYQRLGIRFEIAHGGAHVLQVVKNSIAEKTTLKDADVIIKMAGVAIKGTQNVIDVVKRQAPGTWMPLTVKRKNKTIELVAKFPPLK